MRADTFTFEADDQRSLFVYRWLPDRNTTRRGVVHIAHGMAEHAARYEPTAEALTEAGWAVYANDHRGHGQTARSASELGYFGSDAGFRRTVRDLDQLITRERHEQPGLPVVLMGHSMGAYMTQLYIAEHGRNIRGAVLSGTSGKPGALASAAKLVSRFERRRLGERGKSALLMNMSFGSFNKPFAPTRTPFDWLSRDKAEVDKYIADPLCGFAMTTSLWVDLLDVLSELARPELHARIPRDLPIYVFSGSRDPVGDNTRGVKQLLTAYRVAGILNVKHRFYSEGRHEMLNEINRDEVIRDLIHWLNTEVH